MKRLLISNVLQVFFAICLIHTSLSAFSLDLDPGGKQVQKGIENFGSKEPKKSLKHYSEARKYLKDNSQLDFNEGTSFYQDKKYNKAIDSFQKSLNGQSPEDKAKTWYNIGNSYYKAGKKKEAAMSYIESLKHNPKFEKSLKNLEFLHKKQKQQNQKKNKQSKQNQKSQNQENQDSSQSNRNDENSQKQSDKKPQNSSKKQSQESIEDMMKKFDLDNTKRKSTRIENKQFFW